MTYMISSMTSSRGKNFYNPSWLPDPSRIIGSFYNRSVWRTDPRPTDTDHSVVTNDNATPPGFTDGFKGLPPGTTFTGTLTGILNTTNKNLPSFREIRRMVSTPPSYSMIHTSPTLDDRHQDLAGTLPAPAARQPRMPVRCAIAGGKFVGKQVYYLRVYFRVHLWHGIMSTGKGMNYDAIEQTKAEVNGYYHKMLDAISASTGAGKRRTAENRQLLLRHAAGPLGDMVNTLTALDQNVHGLKPKNPKAKADPEHVDILETIRTQLDRQFADGSGRVPADGAAGDALKIIDKLRDAGVVLSVDLSQVDALVAQLLQDITTINDVAEIIDNPAGLDSSGVNDRIHGLLTKRGQSDLQILRNYGFLSLSEADHAMRAFDYLMTGLANPDHKLNYVLQSLTKKALYKGGKDDIVNMIMTMTEHESMTLKASWGRGLTAECYAVGELRGPAEGYLGGIPHLKLNQSYEYQLKFSKTTDGSVKVTFGRTSKVGPSMGSNIWLGGKIFQKIFNLELVFTAKLGRDYTHEDMLSFELSADPATRKRDLKKIMHGKVNNPFDMLRQGVKSSSSSEKKKTNTLNFTIGICTIYGKIRRIDQPIAHDNQLFLYPGLSASKEVGHLKYNKHGYDSSSGKYTHSKGSEYFASSTTWTANMNVQTRARFLNEIGAPPTFERGGVAPIINTTNAIAIGNRGDSRPLHRTFGEKTVYGGSDTSRTTTARVPSGDRRTTTRAPIPLPLHSTSGVLDAPSSRLARFMALLEKVLKGMRSSGTQGVYARPTVTRDDAGRPKAAFVEITLPRTEKVLRDPTIKDILKRQDLTQRAETRERIIDEVGYTTEKNRTDIKQKLGELRSRLGLQATVAKLDTFAKFTTADGLIVNGDRQNFRATVKKIQLISSDEGVKQIVRELLMLTDSQDTVRWPPRGNGTKITLRLDVRPEMIGHIKEDAITSGEIKALAGTPGFFGGVGKTTIEQSRSKTTSLILALPGVSFSSSASVTLSSPRIR